MQSIKSAISIVCRARFLPINFELECCLNVLETVGIARVI